MVPVACRIAPPPEVLMAARLAVLCLGALAVSLSSAAASDAFDAVDATVEIEAAAAGVITQLLIARDVEVGADGLEFTLRCGRREHRMAVPLVGGQLVSFAAGLLLINSASGLYETPSSLSLSRAMARGLALAPLYPSVPEAALKDARLYAALALLDALRMGQAREREAALKLLKSQFL